MSQQPTFFLKLSGVVSLTNNRNVPFALTVDHQGNVSYNDQASTIYALADLNQFETWLTTMFGLLDNITLNTAPPTVIHHVNGLSAEFSGRVSIPNPAQGQPSWRDFVVQYSTIHDDSGWVGASTPTGGDGVTAWDLARTYFSTQLNSILNPLGIQVS